MLFPLIYEAAESRNGGVSAFGADNGLFQIIYLIVIQIKRNTLHFLFTFGTDMLKMIDCIFGGRSVILLSGLIQIKTVFIRYPMAMCALIASDIAMLHFC